MSDCPLSAAEVEHFLEWCFSTDPDFDPDSGRLRCLIKDTGAAGLCKDVSKELLKFVAAFPKGRQVELLHLDLPHPRYPRGDELDWDHWVCVIDGVVVDFTAKQFEIDDVTYPVPYVWELIDASTDKG